MTEAGVADTRCRLCGNEAEFAFDRPSDLLGQTFSIYTCDACRFAFVANPCLDFARIYDEAYYRGEGADTLVRYLDELDRPEGCLRTLEWDGIALWVREVAARKSLANPRILDFGCGNGLLADYLSRHGFAGCVGWDRGWMADTAPQRGMPILEEFPHGREFDIILAVEVLEHADDPLAMLASIRSLLRPGGVLLLTTGNADPWWRNLSLWGYIAPEIHLSLFTPRSLSLAFSRTGFTAEKNVYSAAWRKILLYKILKNLSRSRLGLASRLAGCTPDAILRRIDQNYGVTAMPYAVAQEGGTS